MQDEVIKAYEFVIARPFFRSTVIDKEHWKILFNYYNSFKSNEPLTMSCIPCYTKVLQFVSSQLKNKSA